MDSVSSKELIPQGFPPASTPPVPFIITIPVAGFISVAIDASSNIEFLFLTERERSGLSEAVSSGIGIVFGELGASKDEEIAKRHPIPMKSTRSNQAMIPPKSMLSETLDNYTQHTKNATVIEHKLLKETNGLYSSAELEGKLHF